MLQANKNTLLKGMIGTQGVALALAVKAWWQPSFWFALSAGYDFYTRLPRFGCTVGTENYGNIRHDHCSVRSLLMCNLVHAYRAEVML